MLFSKFIGRIESDGLFHRAYEDVWVAMPWIFGASMDDTYSAYMMGGEL
jgi:hypothetical protein